MRITSKGQVTIPQHVRDALGLHPDTEVEFAIERGAAVIRPAQKQRTIGARTTARLKQGPKMVRSSRELMALLRDDPVEIDAG